MSYLVNLVGRDRDFNELAVPVSGRVGDGYIVDEDDTQL